MQSRSPRDPDETPTAVTTREAAAFELGRRSVADWPAGRWTIRSPADVARPLVADMGRLEREELRVLSLNTKNVVQRATTVYVGNVSASLVRIGELFRDAVRLDAAEIKASVAAQRFACVKGHRAAIDTIVPHIDQLIM